jgi:hypothetical protein
MNDLDPYKLFSYIFGVSSVSGLAALLRSGQALTFRAVLSAFLNSGLFGVGIAMVWTHLYGMQYPWFMVGVSLLAGLGGISLMDFAYTVLMDLAKNYASRAAESLPLPEHTQKDSGKHE